MFTARYEGRPQRCIQLGRIHDGRFGWVDGARVFRPVGITTRGAPFWCGSRAGDMGGNPHVALTFTLTDPSDGHPGVRRAVVWGIAGPDARWITVGERGDHRVGAPGGRSGAFLFFAPTGQHASGVTLDVDYGGGRHARTRPQAALDSFVHLFNDHPHAVPGAPPHVAARAADPAGGLPWATVAVRSDRGGWCVGPPGRLAGGHVGSVDLRLGTLEEVLPLPELCADPEHPLTREQPLTLTGGSSGGALGSEPGARRPAGRVERRTVGGTTIEFGAARADVRTITVTSPRDVHTLIPAGPAHAWLVVYDGTFPTGTMTLTSTFADGGTARTELPLGGP